MSNVYYSPDGNIEIHNLRPEGYFTVDEWDAKQPKQATSQSIQRMLAAIDMASIRPLRAIARGYPAPEEMTRLEELGEQAVELRMRLTGSDGAI